MRPTRPHQHHRTTRSRSTTSSNLPSETAEALLKAIKKHAEEWEQQPASVGAEGALKDLAEAYAWLQRPIRGTTR